MQRLQQVTDPITDVMLVTHGYQQDRKKGVKSCCEWLKSMAECERDIAVLRASRNGTFRPLLVGLCWPSSIWALPGWRDTSSFLASFLNWRRWPLFSDNRGWGEYLAFGRFEPRAGRIGSRAGRKLLWRLKKAEQDRTEQQRTNLQQADGGGGSTGERVRYHVWPQPGRTARLLHAGTANNGQRRVPSYRGPYGQ